MTIYLPVHSSLGGLGENPGNVPTMKGKGRRSNLSKAQDKSHIDMAVGKQSLIVQGT
jgi:hypothetical protein